jgi:DNA-binding transcriptional LysR family regulator
LGISQPSLTRTLRDLEDLCGRPLLTRSPLGITAARETRELARLAGLTFAEIGQGFALFRESHGQIDGSIVIGSLPLARSALVPNAVTALLQRHPELRLRIVDGPYAELLHGLRSGQLDCIVGALRLPPPADIRQESLFVDNLSIVVRPGHPLLARPGVTTEDYARLAWILPPAATPARHRIERFFAGLGLASRPQVIECSSLIAVRGLLRQSDRAALLSRAQVGFEIRCGHLALLAGPLPGTEREIGLALRADWHPTLAQRDFLTLLRAAHPSTLSGDARGDRGSDPQQQRKPQFDDLADALAIDY